MRQPQPDRVIRTTLLPNGIRVITEPMPAVRSVAVGFWIGTGSRARNTPGERHLPLHRAHALQGHAHAAPPRTSPAKSTPSAATSTPSPAANSSATTPKSSTSTCPSPSTSSPTCSCNPRFDPEEHREGKGRHPRRAQDGNRQPRELRPRALRQPLLERPSARPPHSRHQDATSPASPRDACADYPSAATTGPATSPSPPPASSTTTNWSRLAERYFSSLPARRRIQPKFAAPAPEAPLLLKNRRSPWSRSTSASACPCSPPPTPCASPATRSTSFSAAA